LVDTNVLVYSLDTGDAPRHARAAEVVARLGADRAVVSTQVLSEFANVVTHPHKLAMDSAIAEEAVRNITGSCRVLPVTPETVVAALRARDRWGLEFFDAQIWAVAALNGVPTVLSEDFAHRTDLGGVTFVDPFSEDFDLATL
jgi:predicted nucleic acid-binding protein